VKILQYMLDRAAEKGLQIIVLTCNADDYLNLGASSVQLRPVQISSQQTAMPWRWQSSIISHWAIHFAGIILPLIRPLGLGSIHMYQQVFPGPHPALVRILLATHYA
jgi:hypothetical protein